MTGWEDIEGQLSKLSCNNVSGENLEGLTRIVRLLKLFFKVYSAFFVVIHRRELLLFVSEENEKVLNFDQTERNEKIVLDFIAKNIGVELYETNELINLRSKDKAELATSLLFTWKLSENAGVGALCMQDFLNRRFTDNEKAAFAEFGLLVKFELNRIIQHAGDEGQKDINEVSYENVIGILDSYDAVKIKTNTMLKNFGVNYREWRVLNGIVNADKSIPKEIGRHAQLSKPLMSRYLKSLEAKGLVERVYSVDKDKRYVYIECTEEGRQIWSYGVKNIVSYIRSTYKNIVNNLIVN